MKSSPLFLSLCGYANYVFITARLFFLCGIQKALSLHCQAPHSKIFNIKQTF